MSFDGLNDLRLGAILYFFSIRKNQRWRLTGGRHLDPKQ